MASNNYWWDKIPADCYVVEKKNYFAVYKGIYEIGTAIWNGEDAQWAQSTLRTKSARRGN